MPTNGMILVFYLGKIPGFNLYSTDSDKTVALFTISILFLATCIAPLLIALALKKLKIIVVNANKNHYHHIRHVDFTVQMQKALGGACILDQLAANFCDTGKKLCITQKF